MSGLNLARGYLRGGRGPWRAPLPLPQPAEKSYEYHRPVLSRSCPSGGSRCERCNPGQCPLALAPCRKSLGRDGQPRREDRRAPLRQRRSQDGRGDDGGRLIVPSNNDSHYRCYRRFIFLPLLSWISGRESVRPFNIMRLVFPVTRNSAKLSPAHAENLVFAHNNRGKPSNIIDDEKQQA